MDALVALIARHQGGAARPARTDAELAARAGLPAQAQFYLDFVEAENSIGFHAPQEAARILGESIDLARQGQLALRSGGASAPPRPVR